ncbi:MAG: glutamate racemase [Nitrosopumilaceae archaeon]
MAKIVVFDSGLGSISIIKSIQKTCKSKIIYFADQENFPYGKKSKLELEKIIKRSIDTLEKKFNPDLIVIGSNTPTIMLDITNKKIFGINPPLQKAAKYSKSKNVGILGTESMIKSKKLSKFIISCGIPKDIKIHKINASDLVQLVESGKFLKNTIYCKHFIKNLLENIFLKNQIDVVTLSSTHLPFLKPILVSVFPKIRFIDPADDVARKICKKFENKPSGRNFMKIYSSDKTKTFQKNLSSLGIKNKIYYFSI